MSDTAINSITLAAVIIASLGTLAVSIWANRPRPTCTCRCQHEEKTSR